MRHRPSPASPEAGGSSMQAAPACEIHAFRSARAVLTVGSRRADIGAAQLRARRGAVVSVRFNGGSHPPAFRSVRCFHVKHLCWASRTLRSRRFGTGSSNRKSRQQQIGAARASFSTSWHKPSFTTRVLFSTLRNAQSLLPDADVKRLVRKPVLANGLPRSRKTCRTSPKTSALAKKRLQPRDARSRRRRS